MSRNSGDNDGLPEYKYNVESALIVTCTFAAVMTIGALSKPEQLAQIPEDCHVYAICTRPRLRLLAADLVGEGDGVSSFDVHIATADENATLRFRVGIPLAPGTIIDSSNGGANAIFRSADGELVSDLPTAFLLGEAIPMPLDTRRPNQVDRDMLDLSVQYVGQAYGKDGSRNALRRLANHETLQKILGELNDQGSGRQAWIVVFRFDEHSSASLIGPWKSSASADDSMANWMGVLSTPLPGDQLTTLAEGSLIRYFRPPFNERYKDTFPSAEHTSYKLPYKLDANSIGFEFETMDLGVRLGSEAVSPRWIHTGLYSLSDPSARRAFLDFLTGLRSADR